MKQKKPSETMQVFGPLDLENSKIEIVKENGDKIFIDISSPQRKIFKKIIMQELLDKAWGITNKMKVAAWREPKRHEIGRPVVIYKEHGSIKQLEEPKYGKEYKKKLAGVLTYIAESELRDSERFYKKYSKKKR